MRRAVSGGGATLSAMIGFQALGTRLFEREAAHLTDHQRRSLDQLVELRELQLFAETLIDLSFERGSLTDQDTADVLELAEAGKFLKSSASYAAMMRDSTDTNA